MSSFVLCRTATGLLPEMSFHPAQFSIVHEDRHRGVTSFVGIRRNGEGEPTFVLPPGFDEFPVSDVEEVSTYFFKLFRALRYFREYQKRFRQEKNDFSGQHGVRVSVKNSDPAMLYTKIRVLEEVIERYDELRIYNILYRSRRTEEVDYSQIHRYLDEAIYQNDIPYVEEMRLSRPVVEMGVSTLVRMFCFIYAEIASRIEEELNPEVQAEAARFKSRHLAPDSGLFGSVDSHGRTVDRLKEKLDGIDREVSYKDEDYWYFFEAVEIFLYGEVDESEDGIVWGISNFAPVWEDMCMVWINRNQWDGIIYADSKRYSNTRIGGHSLFADDSFDYSFAFSIDGSKRHMRPDMVRKEESSPEKLFEIDDEQFTVRIWVEEINKSSRAKEILDELKKEIKNSGAAGIKESTRSNKWSYTFYGMNKKILKGILKSVSEEYHFEGEFLKVVDFKCTPAYIYESGGEVEKSRSDERQQITYEYALQLGGASKTTSQLCIPKYFSDPPSSIGRPVSSERLQDSYESQEIEVLRVDFEEILQEYLSN